MIDLLIGAALAAIVGWRTVRIVNRRERWAKWTAVVLVAALSLSMYDGLAGAYSEGTTDLEIVFAVSDMNTSASIEGAIVDVLDNGRISAGRSPEEIELRTDRDGMAT